MNITQFLQERDDALLSLSRAKILRYMEKYDPEVWHELKRADPELFWTAIHKARITITSLPAAERKKSRQWLASHKIV